MTSQELPNGMVRAAGSGGTTEGYMPGFGNDFETEALPGALPQGMNSPQKCNYGLYGEQLSGTAFTAPSHQNERTWCYRIRPSVKHSARYRRIDLPYWKSAPHVPEGVTSLGQYRWDPVPHQRGEADLADRHAHDDDSRRREHPGRHGEPHLPRDRLDGGCLFLLRRQRAAGRAAGGAAAILRPNWA